MFSKGVFLGLFWGSGGIIIPNRSLWHQKTRISESECKSRSNDLFGFKDEINRDVKTFVL